MKLHPLSVPYRAVQGAFQLAWVFFVAGFGVTTVADGLASLVLFGVVVIGTLTAVVVWQVAYYRRYEYELTDDTFDIASGVISRREREIPYDRIQNVSINRNVFQRALGLAEVRVETAGGDTTEVHLQYVSREEADRLQNEVSDRKRRTERPEPVEGDADAPPEREPAELLFEITSRELGVLGIVSLDARLIPLLLFGLSPFFPTLSDWVAGASAFFVVPVAVLALYLVSAIVSAAYSVTNYYGFRLFRTGEELRYERGLLQRFSGTIPLEKVQALTISENVLARTAGYASLLVETAGYSPGETGGSQSAVPVARRDRVLRLARDIEPVDLPAFERPPKRARERYVFRYLGVLAVLAGVVYGAGYVFGESFPWYWVLAGVPLAPVAAHLKWRHRGYALTDDYVITRNGFWSRTIKIVPYHRIQTVIDSRTVFQRRRRLATLSIDTAGSRSLVNDDSRAVDIDEEVAADLRETLADRLLESLEERERERRARRRASRSSASSGPTERPGDASSEPGSTVSDTGGSGDERESDDAERVERDSGDEATRDSPTEPPTDPDSRSTPE